MRSQVFKLIVILLCFLIVYVALPVILDHAGFQVLADPGGNHGGPG